MSNGTTSQENLTAGTSAETVPWERVEKFFGQLSHDIRNSLNACELQLTFLGETSADADTLEEIKRLRASLAGITRQLQNVRVSMGGATGHRMEYPVRDLAEDLKERFERSHPDAAARIGWKLEISPDKLVCVDPELVLASGLEILKNAAQFSDRDVSVSCVVREEDGSGSVSMSVAHTLTAVPSIPPGDWGKSPLLSSRRGAYGLGLFRVRRALAASDCELDCRWSEERKILTVAILFPGVTATLSA